MRTFDLKSADLTVYLAFSIYDLQAICQIYWLGVNQLMRSFIWGLSDSLSSNRLWLLSTKLRHLQVESFEEKSD